MCMILEICHFSVHFFVYYSAPEVRKDSSYSPVVQVDYSSEDTNPFSGEGEEELLLNRPVLYGSVQRAGEQVS